MQRLIYEGVSVNPLRLLVQLLINRYGNGSINALHYSAGSVDILLNQNRSDPHVVDVRVQAETDGAHGEQLLLFSVTEKELLLI